MTMTRRAFLSASAALAAVPAFGQTGRAAPLPREADIVVIGAGAAGIAAARRIVAANRKVIVLEAASQVGGRCVTDTSTFDVPFDRGARWIHNPETNPMIKLGRAAGLEIMPAPTGQKIRIGRRNARASETEEFLAALVKANRAIDEASRGRVDVSCASVMPKELGDWSGTADFVLGANFAGKDLKDISADRQGPRPGPQFRDRLPAGAGHADRKTCRAAAAVAVDAGEPHRMGQSRRRSCKRRPARSPRAPPSSRCRAMCSRAATSSSRPTSPSARSMRRQSSASAASTTSRCSCRAIRSGLARDDILIEQSNSTRTALLYANMGSSSLCSIDVGGSFGRDLSAQGEAAMVAFAIEWLTKLFGSDLAKAVKKSSATRWNASPLCAGRDVGGAARRAAVAKGAERAGRLHVFRRRSHP